MVFHNVLDQVFSTWSHIAVLRVLQDAAKGLTGREIARLAKMSHRSCLKALTTLEGLSIVNRHRGGRDHTFALNREHLLVQEGIIPLLKLEQRFLDSLVQLLKKKVGSIVVSQILFGSVARKEEDALSDFDICFVVKRKAEKERVDALLDGLSPIVKSKFGARLSPLTLSISEFATRATRDKPPVCNIVRDGVVLSGKSLRDLTNGSR